MPKKRDAVDPLGLDSIVEHLLLYGDLPAPDELRALREAGVSLNPAFELMHNAAAMAALWARVRDAVLRGWTAQHPGERPFSWWLFDAPRGTFQGRPTPGAAPRQLIGGTGTLDPVGFDADAIARAHGALPVIDVDPRSPALVESEASYLKRIGELTSAEGRSLGASCFDPDVIIDSDDDDD